jgi:hypothetical protein
MFMRKFFMLAFLFLFPAISYSQPSIIFDTENYDFGTVAQSDTIEHSFEFSNKGDEELIIKKLVPS